MEEIDQLIEEQCECSEVYFGEETERNEDWRRESSVQNTSSLPKVTLQLIEDVCNSISKDPCVLPSFSDSCEKLEFAELKDKLDFLNSCLVPQGKFINAAKEKAWGNYYSAYLQHQACLTAVTKCSQLSARISLYTFQRLIAQAYNYKRKENPVIAVQEEERSTIRYVGGCIIKKMTKKVRQLKPTLYREEKLKCLDLLTGNSDCASEPSDMTTLLDRGGLTHIKPQVAEVFLSAEVLFRNMAGTGDSLKEVNAIEFVAAGIENREIADGFFDILCDHDVSRLVLEDTLKNALKLFFKIRIHHKLKMIMDRIRYKDCKEKREKRLRKKLTSN